MIKGNNFVKNTPNFFREPFLHLEIWKRGYLHIMGTRKPPNKLKEEVKLKFRSSLFSSLWAVAGSRKERFYNHNIAEF